MMYFIAVKTILVSAVLFALISIPGPIARAQVDRREVKSNAKYFPEPGKTWEQFDPIPSNIDVASLNRGLDFAGTRSSYAVLVLLDGRILAEQYWNGHDRNSTAPLYSASKSFISTLIGIAIAERKLTGVTQSVGALLDEWKTAKGYSEITIEHLLTMTSGLEGGKPNFLKSSISRDERAFATSLPLDATPGTRWDYHNSAYRLLFDVLAAGTKTSVDQYSQEKLFEPLNIEHARWKKKRFGKNQYAHLEMSARDAARFGLLYLRNGKWRDKQIVPVHWIEQATSPVYRKVNSSYGYLWWLNGGDEYFLPLDANRYLGPIFPDCPADTYAALGMNDQKIYVVPSLDLVVVRLGDRASKRSAPALSRFDNEFLGQICQAIEK